MTTSKFENLLKQADSMKTQYEGLNNFQNMIVAWKYNVSLHGETSQRIYNYLFGEAIELYQAVYPRQAIASSLPKQDFLDEVRRREKPEISKIDAGLVRSEAADVIIFLSFFLNKHNLELGSAASNGRVVDTFEKLDKEADESIQRLKINSVEQVLAELFDNIFSLQEISKTEAKDINSTLSIGRNILLCSSIIIRLLGGDVKSELIYKHLRNLAKYDPEFFDRFMGNLHYDDMTADEIRAMSKESWDNADDGQFRPPY